jgi:1,4-alpha-glucan branching enzyme
MFEKRRKRAELLEERLTSGRMSLADFASAHEYFGLHRQWDCWVFREWAPLASSITLYGDFSNWECLPEYALSPIGNGVWEIKIPLEKLDHGMHYLMHVSWSNGSGARIPAYARKVEQDKMTGLFSAMVWTPDIPYTFKHETPPTPDALFIYEAHVGMAQEEPKVGTFAEFRKNILPRIAASGYNTIQFMAVMGHPYYGSFGYHVANFFAVAGRFGTPEDFKELVDACHGAGLRVIIDLVHSHAVKNEREGLARIDGTSYAYFHQGPRGLHSAWDSLCFDYSKTEVLHFLLSNCRYFLDEFKVDGFRFDGVTSMLYHHHGLGKTFNDYSSYFHSVDEDALAYLTIANKLIHQLRPDAVTIAEDVSGMPGLASPEGAGFDCRMAMGVTDMWFKLFDQPDEHWNMFYLYGELLNKRPDEHTVSYVECHDQSIVGGKTAIFTLADRDMYDFMNSGSQNLRIDRAIALHKLIRLATAATSDSGYLNFMGNEFGHPEWVDFPREGNNWSMERARRKWSLADDSTLRYQALARFDREMLRLLENEKIYRAVTQTVRIDNEKKVLIFERGGLWFCFNFHPSNSYTDYAFEALPGSYAAVLDSDAGKFDGFDRRIDGNISVTLPSQSGEQLKVYLPCRTALVLKRL